MARPSTAVRRLVVTALALGALAGTSAFVAAAPAAAAFALARDAVDRVVSELASSAPPVPAPAPYVLLHREGLMTSLLDGLV
jgi:hypothetical protein